jgi:hypothetical protein
MKTAAVVIAFEAALAGLVILLMPTAHADDYCYENCGYEHKSWPGQLVPTWDTPGTYGGITQDPVLCDPQALKCRVVATP